MWNDRAFIPQRAVPEYTRGVGCIPICEMNGEEESTIAISARMAAAREEFYDDAERRPPVFVDVTRDPVEEERKQAQQRMAAVQGLEYGRATLKDFEHVDVPKLVRAADPRQHLQIVMPKQPPCGDMTHHYECMHHLDVVTPKPAPTKLVPTPQQFADVLGQLEMIGRNLAHARVLLGAVATSRFIGFEDLTAMEKDLRDLKISVRELQKEVQR